MPQSEAADRPDQPEPEERTDSVEPVAAVEFSGPAVVTIWPATSQARVPASVRYVDVRPGVARRPSRPSGN